MSRPSIDSNSVVVLGLNAWHGDAAACLLIDGEVVAAVEEERLRRIKHWAGLPSEAVQWCLDTAGIELSRIDHVAINRDPKARIGHKLIHAMKRRVKLSQITDRLNNARRVGGVIEELEHALGAPAGTLRAKLHQIEHHRAHLASAFFPSPFKSAAVASIDGFGDFSSAAWGSGVDSEMLELGRVGFPHSLGVFYLALTQYLGFSKYGDEYKVMGLAAYGEPKHKQALSALVQQRGDGGFRLDLKYFCHADGGVPMSWDGGEPTVGRAYSDELVELLGPARKPDEPLRQRHKDLAASIQAVYEDALFSLLRELSVRTSETRLCLAGGCAMNSLANGKILENTPFRELWVQAAAGDAGGAMGAALAVWRQELERSKTWAMSHAYLGPHYTQEQIDAAVASCPDELEESGAGQGELLSEADLVERTARHLANGHVVGWFQGAMEWGPRALGARSILGDPRRTDMQDLLNLKIKRRESFRPFAPSVLAERQHEWFESEAPVPFMGQVFGIKLGAQERIPAVCHADGTGRLQSVTAEANPRYHALISAFADKTDVPMLLNTSFNENEPIVNTPEQALSCFLRTKMDVLVMGDRILERIAADTPVESVRAALPQGAKQAAEQQRAA